MMESSPAAGGTRPGLSDGRRFMSQCPACASFNEDGVAFCGQCGQGLMTKGRRGRSRPVWPLGRIVLLQALLVAGVVWILLRPGGDPEAVPSKPGSEGRGDRRFGGGTAGPLTGSSSSAAESKTVEDQVSVDRPVETLDESEIAARLEKTLVVIELANAGGRTIREIRGVVVHSGGVVLCRYATLLGAYRATCRLHQDRRERVPVRGIIRHDVAADLALLRLDSAPLSLPALTIVEDPSVTVFQRGDRLFVFSGHRPRRAVIEEAGFSTADGRVGMLLASTPRVVPEAFLAVEPIESAVVGLCRPLVDGRTVAGGGAAVGVQAYQVFVDGVHSLVNELEQPVSTTLDANTQRFFEGTFVDLVIQARNAYRGKRWAEAIELFGQAFRQGAAERIDETRLAEIDRLLRESYLAEIQRLRDSQRLDEAGEVTVLALRDFERDSVLWLRLAEIRVEQGRSQDAITAFLEVRALEGGKRVDSLLEREYRALAEERLDGGDGRAAELVYIDGIEQVERSGVLRLALGRLYLLWEAYEDSVRLLEEARRLDSSLRDQVDVLLEKIDDILADRDAVVLPIPEGSASIRTNVVVNQQFELPFLVDTGATYTSISNDLAKRLGYDTERGPSTVVNTAAGPKRVRVVRLTSLSLAGYNVRNLDVFVLPVEAGARVNLLGLNFLNFFKFSVDSKRREFRLERQ